MSSPGLLIKDGNTAPDTLVLQVHVQKARNIFLSLLTVEKFNLAFGTFSGNFGSADSLELHMQSDP